MIRSGKRIIKDPKSLYREKDLLECRAVNARDEDFFLVPDYLKRKEISDLKNHSKMQSYKVGFLYEYLNQCFPQMKSSDIYSIIFDKYQVYLSQRNMQKHVTIWRKNRNEFLNIHVPNKD